MQSLKIRLLTKLLITIPLPFGKRTGLCILPAGLIPTAPFPREVHCAQWAALSPEWHLLGTDWQTSLRRTA